MKPSDNPFRSSAIATQRYRIAPEAYAGLLQRAQQKDYRVCLRGPHGTGKSTLLQDIARSLEEQGEAVCWYYLNRQMPWMEKWRVLKNILQSDRKQLNFLDGGETVGYVFWVGFLVVVKLKRKTLLATTHVVSPLTTLYKTQVDESMMLCITQTLAGDYWSQELRRLALAAYANSSGNCREVFRACYFFCGGIKDKS